AGERALAILTHQVAGVVAEELEDAGVEEWTHLGLQRRAGGGVLHLLVVEGEQGGPSQALEGRCPLTAKREGQFADDLPRPQSGDRRRSGPPAARQENLDFAPEDDEDGAAIVMGAAEHLPA